MVRHKARWLLVRINQEGHDEENQPTRKELGSLIRGVVEETLGVAAAGFAQETHVRFSDPSTRLLLIRTPRQFADKIRSALLFVTTWHGRRMSLDTLSVHGSARTAKIAAIKCVRQYYRQKMSGKNMKEIGRTCKDLDDLLKTLQAIDY